MNRILLLAFLTFALAACQTPEPEPTVPAAPEAPSTDTEADRESLLQMDEAYERAMQTGDVAALVALHADDAVVLPANGPILRGKAAIEAELTERYGEAAYGEAAPVTLTTEDVVVSESGDLAYVIGSSTEPDGAGKYLTVFRRTADGWEIAADIWNMDQPASDTTDS